MKNIGYAIVVITFLIIVSNGKFWLGQRICIVHPICINIGRQVNINGR